MGAFDQINAAIDPSTIDDGLYDPSTDGGQDFSYGDASTVGMPDTSALQSSMGRMRGLAESYLGGIDPTKAFDQIKQSKINALRAARAAFEKPADEMNLPLMAFGAEMLRPTRSGRMGEAVANSVDHMIPLVQDQRQVEQARRSGMAELGAQEAALPGEDLYGRITAGTEALNKASDLDFKIQQLKQTGAWKFIDRQTRIRLADAANKTRLEAAQTMAGARESQALQQAVRQAQQSAQQDAQNLISQHYNIPPDQYNQWIVDRTQHILNTWGYKPEDYQGALTPGGAMQPGAQDAPQLSPDEQDLQQELEQEQPRGAPQQQQFVPPATTIPVAPIASPGDVGTTGKIDAPAGTPGSPWQRQNAQLSPGEAKDVDEADTMVNQTMLAEDALQQALALNDKAFSGDLAGAHAWIERQADWMVPGYNQSEGAKNTTMFRNLVNTQVVNNLKATFGGSGITEGERAYLENLQASIDKSPEERAMILKQGLKLLGARRKYSEWKAKQIREGNMRVQSYAEFLKNTNDPLYQSVTGSKP